MSKAAWMPMRLDLGDDPRVARLARMLSVSRFEVVGRLHDLWSWAQRHTADGRLEHTTLDDLNDRAADTRWGDALLAVGWVEVDAQTGAVTLPRWETWNSNNAKQRVQTARRVANKRDRDADPPAPPSPPDTPTSTSALCNAASVTPALQVRDLQNRTEEKKNTHTHACAGVRARGEGTEADAGGDSDGAGGGGGPIPFPGPIADGPLPVARTDGAWAKPIEQGEGPGDWPQVTTEPGALSWAEVEGGPGCLAGMHSTGAVRKRVAAKVPEAMDLAWWDDLREEVTAYLRRHEPRTHPADYERWLLNTWIPRRRPLEQRQRDGPGAEGTEARRDGPRATKGRGGGGDRGSKAEAAARVLAASGLGQAIERKE